MKKILFDFITLQDNYINGGMLYTQKIFYEILNNEVKIYGLYDGNISINERINRITKQYEITLIDIRNENIFEMINNLQIDSFFIGIAQRYDSFDLCSLKCKIVIVCHDLSDMSFGYFKIPQAESLKKFVEKHLIKQKENKIKFIKFLSYPLVLFRRHIKENYKNFKKLIQQPNAFVVTDSEYSKYAIQYFLGNSKNKIEVFYAPISNENITGKTENFSKESLENKKYFLLVSVDRLYKNTALFLEQWDKFCLATNYEYHCVLVGKLRCNIRNCIVIEEVSSEELVCLYKNAFAFIFPSFSEGFGYPPIEAAEYATPSICSNTTSMPEIYGDMPIYFSPFYPEDLFRAMMKMTENREFYVEKTKRKFLEINQRQKQDLKKIVDFILGEKL